MSNPIARNGGGSEVLMELEDGRTIRGVVDEGYGPVADAFRRNFVAGYEVGAACSAFVAGRPVVDLWGGIADRRSNRPWAADTAAVIFSCSKGVLAICMYLLAQQGRLDLDAPMARYWPEFAAGGKGTTTVRGVMAHRAGLPALDADLTRDEALGWQPVIAAIERQRPLWPPDTAHSYHALTYGWLVGEIIRRVTGMTPGVYFGRELGDPLGLHTWIGLPDSARDSVAWMEPPLPDPDTPAARANARQFAESRMLQRSLSMGGAFEFPTHEGVVTFNDPAIQAAEVPAANGISTARSLARLYAGCVSEIDGPKLMTAASIDDALIARSIGPQWSGIPDDGARWGTGFQLASTPLAPMLGPRSFGHCGAGGQLAFADDEYGAGFAYLANQMGVYLDERANHLTEALASVLRRRAPRPRPVSGGGAP
jgi:CubicO group peptidase (beta-lactamase class C family)